MKNLTVSLPDAVLDRLRVLAAQKKLSVNRYVGELLSELTGESTEDWKSQHEALLKEIGSRPRVGTWNREEIYADRIK